MKLNINLVDTKEQKWFYKQLERAEAIISSAIDKADNFGPFDKKSLKAAVTQASMIDVSLLQLLHERLNSHMEISE